jgi:hypothetical protein
VGGEPAGECVRQLELHDVVGATRVTDIYDAVAAAGRNRMRDTWFPRLPHQRRSDTVARDERGERELADRVIAVCAGLGYDPRANGDLLPLPTARRDTGST